MDKGEDFFLRDNQIIDQNEELSEKSKRRLNRSKAENTVKAYDADWRDFLDWCAAHEKTPLPAAPETIVNYVNDLADNARANTVARRVTAISENHIAAGLSAEKNPAHDGMVRAAIAAIRREKGTFQHGKSPILLETLPLLADCFQGDSLPTLRDRALILLGFAGAFRRSELVAVQVEDLNFSPQGLVVFIPRAKGDQTGKGSSVAIPFAPDATICAARAVRDWVNRAGLKTGPLFRAFKRNGELRQIRRTDREKIRANGGLRRKPIRRAQPAERFRHQRRPTRHRRSRHHAPNKAQVGKNGPQIYRAGDVVQGQPAGEDVSGLKRHIPSEAKVVF